MRNSQTGVLLSPLKGPHHFTFSPAVYDSSKFSTSLSTLVVLSILLIIVILVGVKLYLIVVLSYVSLIANNVEWTPHFFNKYALIVLSISCTYRKLGTTSDGVLIFASTIRNDLINSWEWTFNTVFTTVGKFFLFWGSKPSANTISVYWTSFSSSLSVGLLATANILHVKIPLLSLNYWTDSLDIGLWLTFFFQHVKNIPFSPGFYAFKYEICWQLNWCFPKSNTLFSFSWLLWRLLNYL